MNLESPKKRLIIGIILLITLACLCTYYSAEKENHLKYPSYNAILSDYPQGEVVNIGGTVNQVYSDGFQIQENYHGQIVTMKVLTGDSVSKNTFLSKDTPVSVNDKVSIVGVLGRDNQILSVQQIEVNEYWKYIFLLLRSFLALIVLVYIFNRYWRFDTASFEFRRR